jgi:hypothetical protein
MSESEYHLSMTKLFPTLTAFAQRCLWQIVASSAIVTVALPAKAQIVPQPWVTVGYQDQVSYGAGVRAFDYGLEVGTGSRGATGTDVLKFFSAPFVSPYVGLGLYSGDRSVAYSGGVHFNSNGNFFMGVGYHSVRGVNGQVGLKF